MLRVLALLLLAGSLQAADTAGVQVADAWIRWLPGNLPAGGYLTVVNSSDRAVSVVGAMSQDYGSVTLHQSRQQNGVASMAEVEAVKIGPHSRLAFETEGYHLMLEQPRKAVMPGDRVSITIRFASGASISVPFEVRPPGAS
jgi:periplasmic copper chaperone A